MKSGQTATQGDAVLLLLCSVRRAPLGLQIDANADWSRWTPDGGAGMTVLVVVVAVLAVVMTTIAVLTMWWQLYAWRTPDILAGVGFDDEPLPPRHSFTLLAPARHEQAVLDDTLRRLLMMDHPNFEVIAIIGHDDDETREVAERVAADHPDRCRVVIDHNWPKNKPKGMNTALPECRGEIVGVFDAEDEVDLRLLRRVDSAFQTSRADVVQGGVQLMNFRTSWFTLRNCLEYFIWFRSRLHLQALHNFIPLGGNTVFIKTQLLRDTGGWDGECLAEDCDLGVRLSSLGKKVIVCYDPTMATREETPDTIKSLDQTAHPVEPGLHPGAEEGQLQAAAPPPADSGALHPQLTVPAGVHRCRDPAGDRHRAGRAGAGRGRHADVHPGHPHRD